MNCSVDGCLQHVYCKGMCKNHYSRNWSFGDPNHHVNELHGRHKSPEYRAWRHMKDRCLNPKCKSYKYYGGRGITIQPDWIDSFEVFFRDMGPRPASGYSIDRIDNSIGYFKANCHWATVTANSRNTRHVKLDMNKAKVIRIERQNGVSVRELAAKYNVTTMTIYDVANGNNWKEEA